jgi:hypothetical protein
MILMETIKIVVQSHDDYIKEKERVFRNQMITLKYMFFTFVLIIFAIFTAFIISSLTHSTNLGYFFFLGMIAFYIVDFFSKNNKIISYLRLFLGIVYFLIFSLFLVSSIVLLFIDMADKSNMFIGLLVILLLYGYLSYRYLSRYTNIKRIFRR